MTKPSAIALVVCDNVYRETHNKIALVGLFNHILAKKYPVVHPRLCVYVSVTDIRPGTKFKLDIVHSETEEAVIELSGEPPKEATPTTICDLVFEMENLTFLEPGRYYIRFFGNEHPLLQRPFELKKMET